MKRNYFGTGLLTAVLATGIGGCRTYEDLPEQLCETADDCRQVLTSGPYCVRNEVWLGALYNFQCVDVGTPENACEAESLQILIEVCENNCLEGKCL